MNFLRNAEISSCSSPLVTNNTSVDAFPMSTTITESQGVLDSLEAAYLDDKEEKYKEYKDTQNTQQIQARLHCPRCIWEDQRC